ncbi:hypothetical protein ILUMI_15593 [Ignelater luminosus]|uniref:Reverse transcriptase domain-containing protein n=1 Tax=Ignelater luminosus TaxID=2038154 RepID=A0A8K0G3Q5_IGNLU|nr:hypothetical protein ILUMI_15593 [Ignelater luminosus]
MRQVFVEILLKLKWWERQVLHLHVPPPINEDYLFSLNFADDPAVVAQDSNDLEFMVRRLYDEYSKWGLQVSLEKTEYLVINTGAVFEVLISKNVTVNQVDRFKYLGVSINKDGL